MSNCYYIDLTGVENRTELHDRIEQGFRFRNGTGEIWMRFMMC